MSSDSSNPKKTEATAEVDIFRDTPLRYMGYANEVGESFRALVSKKVVIASYVLALGYVACDVIDKSRKEFLVQRIKLEKPSPPASGIVASPTRWENSPVLKTVAVGADCMIWQTCASVAIPGFTINRICKLSLFLLNKTNVKSVMRSSKWLTTAIGLASIPFIIHPIDNACHFVMDKTLRPVLGIKPHMENWSWNHILSVKEKEETK